MPIPELKEAIEYASFEYYSKAMTVFNINTLKLPCPISLDELEHNSNTKSYQFLVRISHGLPHVIPAMELIDEIYSQYRELVAGFNAHFQITANSFDLDEHSLLQLIKIAVVFHDAGREGNNLDLWDEESAQACYNYLVNQCKLETRLAEFIADTIRYKDEEGKFKRKYPEGFFIRELVNMADTLEVIRTRNVFKPQFLPIAKHVTEKIMIERVIPELVVPHRIKIHSQGRLSKKAAIEYKSSDGQTYIDEARPKAGKDYTLIAQTYHDYCQEYDLAILDINENNLQKVFDRALNGINKYLNEHETGLQWTHNGFFSPRYHGALGLNRAKYYKNILGSEEIHPKEKIKALYALFATHDGKSLKEALLRSFNQINQGIILSQLNEMVKKLNETQSLKDINADVQDCVLGAEGLRVK